VSHVLNTAYLSDSALKECFNAETTEELAI